jgi:hypothetical protein
LHAIDENFRPVTASLGTIPFTYTSHTAANIALGLQEVVGKACGQTDWCPTITTDSEAAMSKAVDKINTEMAWIKCACHCLHNSVKEGVKMIEEELDVIERVK